MLIRALRYLVWLWPLWLAGAVVGGIGIWLLTMDANPANIRAEVERARGLIEDKRNDAAFAILTKLIDDNKNANPNRLQTIASPMADAFLLRARIHFAHDRADKAADDSLSSISLRPNVPDGHRFFRLATLAATGCPAAEPPVRSAWCLFDLARYTDAADAFIRILEQSPDSQEAHYGLGVTRLFAGDPDAALASLARAGALAAAAPRYEQRAQGGPIHAARALAYTKLGRRDDAMASLVAAENAAFANPTAFYIRARLHEASGEPSVALQYYERTRVLAANCYNIYFYQARARDALRRNIDPKNDPSFASTLRHEAAYDHKRAVELGLLKPGGDCGAPVPLDAYILPERAWLGPVATVREQLP